MRLTFRPTILRPCMEFNRNLNAKPAAKYGVPDGGIAGRSWNLIENVTDSDGRQRPFTCNWFSVVVLDGFDGVDLTMTMIDFRYIWADNAKVNTQPRDIAVAAFSF